MKKDSRWLDEVRQGAASQILRTWERKYLTQLQNLLERLIIESKEETVALAANPEVRAQKIRIKAGGHEALVRLLTIVKGVLNE